MKFSDSFLKFIQSNLSEHQELRWTERGWFIICTNGYQVSLVSLMEAAIIHKVDLFEELDSIARIPASGLKFSLEMKFEG